MGRTLSPEELFLEFVREAAERRQAAELHFRRAIAGARALDLPFSLIAAAAGLSVSRVHAIDADERAHADRAQLPMERSANDRDVLVVAAGRAAADEYLRYDAYVCQPNRPFRQVSRMGFYRKRHIETYFPLILDRVPEIEFSPQSVARLHARGGPLDRELAAVIEEMLRDGRRNDGGLYEVFLLTPPDDDRTLVLDQPIHHTAPGRGSAWTQGTRYTSETMLRRNPPTTDHLD